MTGVDPGVAGRFLETAFERRDWVAIFLKSYERAAVAQRVGSVSWVQSDRFQRWLRAMNARRYNVFVSVNAIASGRRSRTRDAIGAVRHVFLDADHDGSAVLSRVAARQDLPSPSYVLHSSPNRVHVFWRVIRKSKNEGSKRVLPLNDDAFRVVKTMLERADQLGHEHPEHYLWCATQHHKLDPTKPASKWDTAWRALRDAAGLPKLRFHDLRHTVVTRLLEAGEPDHVVESITGHLSRRMLEHYSHIRLAAKRAALDRLERPRKALK